MIFGNLPKNVINCVGGRYHLVGTIDVRLCNKRPADRAAIMGCRAHEDENGELVEYRSIGANSIEELIAEAEARGFELVEGGGPDGRFEYVGPAAGGA